MTIVTLPYIVSNSGCIIGEDTRQRLTLHEVGMRRKSRRRSLQIRALVLTALVVGAALFWEYGLPIQPIVNWFKQNAHAIIPVVLSLVALAAVLALVWINRGKHKVGMGRKSQRRSLGIRVLVVIASVVAAALLFQAIVKWFTQNPAVVLLLVALAVVGAIVWINRRKFMPIEIGVGKCLPEYTRRPRNMKDQTLASEVWQKIIDFPLKEHYEKERDYQRELYKWLEHKFPGIKVEWEHKKGMSRADISIDRIAIEIKGPTRNRQLKDARAQIGIYGNDYDFIFFVLFNPKWAKSYFSKFEKALPRFPYVGVITNSG